MLLFAVIRQYGNTPPLQMWVFLRLKENEMNKEQLFQHQMRLAHQIKKLSAKSLKQSQAHILCKSLISMIGAKK